MKADTILQTIGNTPHIRVKRLFGDEEARSQVTLSAVNSINWARLMAQVVYYFYAAVRLGGQHGLTDGARLEEGPQVRALDVPHLRFGFGVVASDLRQRERERERRDQQRDALVVGAQLDGLVRF